MLIKVHVIPYGNIAGRRSELLTLLHMFQYGTQPPNADRLIGTLDELILVEAQSIEEADVIVLPFSWNVYHELGLYRKIVATIEELRNRTSAPILTWSSGDFGWIPPLQGIWTIRSAGYRSRRTPFEIIQPFFLTDPIRSILERTDIILRPKRAKPIVGFCGQANPATWKSGLDLYRIASRNILIKLRRLHEDPQVMYPPSLRRSRILDALENSSLIDTAFIRRRKYRAGAANPEMRATTTKEHYNNIDTTDYTVCVRGGGNFSLRLYETLALGRIPLFIDTDCNLPFDDEIDWRDHLLWVDEEDMLSADRILHRVHAAMTPMQFEERQCACRVLWETLLSRPAFWKRVIQKVVVRSAPVMTVASSAN